MLSRVSVSHTLCSHTLICEHKPNRLLHSGQQLVLELEWALHPFPAGSFSFMPPYTELCSYFSARLEAEFNHEATKEETPHQVAPVSVHMTQISSLVFAPNYKWLVSAHGYAHNNAVVWKYPSLRKAAELNGHDDRVRSLTLSPDCSDIPSIKTIIRICDLVRVRHPPETIYYIIILFYYKQILKVLCRLFVRVNGESSCNKR